jgi:hypothetical protein
LGDRGRIPAYPPRRKKIARELVTELETLRSNISSYVPEFMLAALMEEAGFEVSFVPRAEEVKTV